MSVEIPIAEQATEVQHEVDMRVRAYPRHVSNGAISQEKATRKIAAMRAAAATLAIIRDNAEGLRELLRFLRQKPDYSDDEARTLMDHPAAKAVIDAFPDAVLSGIRPVLIPTPDQSMLFDADETH